jgi:hypothetical protein
VGGGVFQAVGKTLRALGRHAGSSRGHLAGDANQLAFDIGLKSTGRVSDQGVQPRDREIEAYHGGERIAPSPVGIEGDDLSHDDTVDPRSDTFSGIRRRSGASGSVRIDDPAP